MKRLTLQIIVTSILVTMFAASAWAQPAFPASQITEFDVNGLKVLVKRRPGTPTVAAGLFFRGGVRNVTAENAGIESMMLSVAAEASKNFPRQRLRKETSSIGTVISAGSNYDFSALAMASTKQHFDRSWAIFTDIVVNPAFAAEDIERIREATLTGLRAQNDSPEGALETLNEKVVYTGHPYANSPMGTVATVSSLKAPDLAAYHKRLLETSRMLLVVVGDVDPTVFQRQVAASFGTLPRGSYAATPVKPLDISQPTIEVNQKAVQTNYVKGTFSAPSIADADYYAMRAAIALLQSNVFDEVRNKRNLSYAPDAEMDSHAANTASISVSSVNPNEAVRVMLAEIDKLRRGMIEEDDLKRMSAYFLTTHYLKLETNAAQVADLAQYEIFGGGWRRSQEFLDKIRSVKTAEVQAVATKYMRNLRFSVIGNPADIDRPVFLRQN